MQFDPAAPTSPARRAPEHCSREGKGSQDEQVIVLGPAQSCQNTGGDKDHGHAPEVYGPKGWMAASVFLAHDRHEASQDTDDPERDMHGEHSEKDRRIAGHSDPGCSRYIT